MARRTTISAARFRSAATRWWSERRTPRSAANSSQGAAYVFTESGSGWANMTQTAKLTASDGAAGDYFGDSVSISGNTVVVGALDATVGSNSQQGAAYVFTEPGSAWANMTQTAKLTASDGAAGDYFGSSVSISGNTVVVGAPDAKVGSNSQQGAAYVFTEPGSGLDEHDPDRQAHRVRWRGGRLFGNSVSISGNTVVVGAPDANVGGNSNQGAAYVFTEPGSGWANMTQTAKLTASDGAAGDVFGTSVSISGDTVVAGAIGAGNQGAAYMFYTPAVANVAVSTTAAANSHYKVGGTVPITVTFSEPVNVSGTPQLTLNDGGVANYTSGSGTATLTFTYAVAAGQNTADLDYASTGALALNGGSIQDLAGNAATLTLPGTDGLVTQNLVIDTTPPSVSITLEPAAITQNTSATFTFTGSDNLTTTANLVYLVSLDGSTFATAASPVNYNSLSLGSHTFQVESEDQAGNISTPASYTWTVNATPTVTVTDASGPYTSLAFAATGSVTGVGGANLGTPAFTYYSGTYTLAQLERADGDARYAGGRRPLHGSGLLHWQLGLHGGQRGCHVHNQPDDGQLHHRQRQPDLRQRGQPGP